LRAFAARVLSFAAVICAPEAAFEVKETKGSGLGLFAVQAIDLPPLQALPGLTGWRRSLGDAEPTECLNSWISNSVASKTADALIGPLSLGNHRCESDLEWVRAAADGAVSVRAKAGKTVRFAAGDEVRWGYGQIGFDCKCPDEHVHASRKRKRLPDADVLCYPADSDIVSAPSSKRPRTRSLGVG
jgi:hypothetical protein